MTPSLPRFKAREFLLLLVPVIALAGFGAYLTKWPSQTLIPQALSDRLGVWRIAVDDVKVEPATPREVALGYDTRVVVQAHECGKTPGPQTGAGRSSGLTYRLVAMHNGKRVDLLRDVGMAQRPKVQGVIGGVAENVVLMKLSAIPVDIGQLELEVEPEQTAYWQGPNGIVKAKAQVSPGGVTVRRAGERVQTPVVSKYRPFVVKKFAVEKGNDILYPPSQGKKVVLEVVCTEDIPHGTPRPRLRCEEMRVVDESGREYEPPTEGFQPASPVGVDYGIGVPGLIFFAYTSHIPASAGKLTLHARVSMDDCWPLDLSLVVRDK